MLTFLKKKRISEDKAANIYVNSLLQLVDDGFPEVAALINEASEFVTCPNIPENDSGKFLLIIMAGNLHLLPGHFKNYQGLRMSDLLLRKLSHAIGLDADILQTSVGKMQKYLKKINHPSKNTHYAMSRAIFYKYGLVQHQEEYFAKMESPNPIFLKRLHEVVANFIWDWEEFLARYRLRE